MEHRSCNKIKLNHSARFRGRAHLGLIDKTVGQFTHTHTHTHTHSRTMFVTLDTRKCHCVNEVKILVSCCSAEKARATERYSTGVFVCSIVSRAAGICSRFDRRKGICTCEMATRSSRCAENVQRQQKMFVTVCKADPSRQRSVKLPSRAFVFAQILIRKILAHCFGVQERERKLLYSTVNYNGD